MAVMTTCSNKEKENEQNMKVKKHQKFLEKTRPITATLEHPLILDIKLLKKLDMTTFTKKGLIALSKFCGISLIKKNDSKRKFNKYIKTIQGSKKQLIKEFSKTITQDSSMSPLKKEKYEIKRKHFKQKIQKIRTNVNFESSDESNALDEDSMDVICKKHNVLKKIKEPVKQRHMPLSENNFGNKKPIIEEVLKSTVKNLIPEPCKTCVRSEYPERFHSHPKESIKSPENDKFIGKMALEEGLKNSTEIKVVLKESFEKGKRRNSAKNCDFFPGKSLSSRDNKKNDFLSQKPPQNKSKSNFTTKAASSIKTPELSPEVKENCFKTKSQGKPLQVQSPTKSESNTDISKSSTSSRSRTSSQEKLKTDTFLSEDTLKYITGCYICGRPISPKTRMKHEEKCILEWRNKNIMLPADSRRPEPKRPDFRFTGDGTLDCKGTFDSIWANHKDSLLPCKKCGRKFFPERIERHEKCCNSLPIKFNSKN